MSEEKEGAPAKTGSEDQRPTKDEAKDLLDAYARVLDIWKVQNDNYFKRVQVAMGIIQVGLFLTALNMLSPLPSTWPQAALPIFISILGVLSGVMWIKLNRKQTQYLEFCRRTLRNLEKRLSELHVPLEYFTLESLVFAPYPEARSPYSAQSEAVEVAGKNRFQLTFKWSDENYPDPDSKDRSRHTMSRVACAGGMVSFEKSLAWGAVVVWVVLGLFVLAVRCEPCIRKSFETCNQHEVNGMPNK